MSFILGVTNEPSMLNAIMLSVVAHFYYAKCHSFILMLSVSMLSVFMLNVIMLSVVAPFDTGRKSNFLYEETPNKFLRFL
jgi:hypothetical protein